MILNFFLTLTSLAANRQPALDTNNSTANWASLGRYATTNSANTDFH
jgi:hypothetical protein